MATLKVVAVTRCPAVRYMMESGCKTDVTDKVYADGPMAMSTKVNGPTTSLMVKVR